MATERLDENDRRQVVFDDLMRPQVQVGYRQPFLKSPHTAEARWVLARVPELLPLAVAASIYSKAFLEALAKRHADGLADRIRTRLRENGTRIEVEIGPDVRASAAVLVTADMPDEARLALLDLDVTADEVRGKLLRWDDSTSAWRPADDK